jgi:hypothetical protein
MSNRTLLPVGTQANHESKFISKGDKLKLDTGDTVTFLEMNRTKFRAKTEDGRLAVVPVWRNRAGTKPFILSIEGKDETVVEKITTIGNLKPGNLFSINNNKESFMFLGMKETRGRRKVEAVDIASNSITTIDSNFTFTKIDLPGIKKQHIV